MKDNTEVIFKLEAIKILAQRDFAEIKKCECLEDGEETYQEGYMDAVEMVIQSFKTKSIINNETSEEKQKRLNCNVGNGTRYWDCYNDCAFWDGKECTKKEN